MPQTRGHKKKSFAECLFSTQASRLKKPTGWLPFSIVAGTTKIRLVKKDVPQHIAGLDVVGAHWGTGGGSTNMQGRCLENRYGLQTDPSKLSGNSHIGVAYGCCFCLFARRHCHRGQGARCLADGWRKMRNYTPRCKARGQRVDGHPGHIDRVPPEDQGPTAPFLPSDTLEAFKQRNANFSSAEPHCVSRLASAPLSRQPSRRASGPESHPPSNGTDDRALS